MILYVVLRFLLVWQCLTTLFTGIKKLLSLLNVLLNCEILKPWLLELTCGLVDRTGLFFCKVVYSVNILHTHKDVTEKSVAECVVRNCNSVSVGSWWWCSVCKFLAVDSSAVEVFWDMAPHQWAVGAWHFEATRWSHISGSVHWSFSTLECETFMLSNCLTAITQWHGTLSHENRELIGCYI